MRVATVAQASFVFIFTVKWNEWKSMAASKEGNQSQNVWRTMENCCVAKWMQTVVKSVKTCRTPSMVISNTAAMQLWTKGHMFRFLSACEWVSVYGFFCHSCTEFHEGSWEEDGMAQTLTVQPGNELIFSHVKRSGRCFKISKHVATTHGNGHTFNKTKWAVRLVLCWSKCWICLAWQYSAHLASSFEMWSVPGFHVVAEVCRSVRMHDEGLIPTHWAEGKKCNMAEHKISIQ